VGLTVQRLLQAHYAGYEQRYRLPRFRRDAAHALATCKTAARGRHLRRCPQGHVQGVWYNSCRHRSCPQCSLLDIDRWLAARAESLLPCAHYHLVFTLPSDLDELWLLNTQLLTELLFASARWALTTMLEDQRRFGARVGVLAVLHTWGRTLCLHPHLHCLLTAGGAAADGSWLRPRRQPLLACRPLGELFRGNFLRRLTRLIRSGKVQLPPDYRSIDCDWLLRRCAKKKWTPHVSELYQHGRGVLQYLARYVRGGPFRNSSLVACDSQRVSFRYRNYRHTDDDGKPKLDTLTLPVDDFLSRLFLHVPKPNTRTIRGWGLYAHTQRPLAERCRQQLADVVEPPQRVPSERPTWEPPAALCCPVCGLRLLVQQLGFDGRSPPFDQVPS
jgi:hypothetical protein